MPGHGVHLAADRHVSPDRARHPDVLRSNGRRIFGSLRRKSDQLEPLLRLPGVGRSLRKPRKVLRNVSLFLSIRETWLYCLNRGTLCSSSWTQLPKTCTYILKVSSVWPLPLSQQGLLVTISAVLTYIILALQANPMRHAITRNSSRSFCNFGACLLIGIFCLEVDNWVKPRYQV